MEGNVWQCSTLWSGVLATASDVNCLLWLFYCWHWKFLIAKVLTGPAILQECGVLFVLGYGWCDLKRISSSILPKYLPCLGIILSTVLETHYLGLALSYPCIEWIICMCLSDEKRQVHSAYLGGNCVHRSLGKSVFFVLVLLIHMSETLAIKIWVTKHLACQCAIYPFLSLFSPAIYSFLSLFSLSSCV